MTSPSGRGVIPTLIDPSMNPYAPPSPAADAPAYGQPQGAGQFFRQGDQLVVAKGAILPDVCIVTGEPTGGRTQSDTAQWIPPWTIIVFLLIRLIGIILMLVMRKTGQFTYYWSESARQKRTRGVIVGLGLVGASIAAFAGGVALNSDASVILVLAGFVLFFVGLILAIVMGRPYTVAKIDEGHVYLKVKPALWAGLQRAGYNPGIFPG